MPSSRYKELSRRLVKLRKHLLPKDFSVTGDYTESQLDRARGYRLLVHAEIESYLEDRARIIVNMCFKRWLLDRRPKTVILNLLSFHLDQKCVSQQDLKREYMGQDARVEKAIRAASEGYNQVLSKNHGVREDSVLKILLPLGIKPSELDQTWINTMDSFGVARGETAHRSVKTQQPVDPKSEFDTVSGILTWLKDVDASLSKIKT
jgi:hypothetical protein